MAPGDAAEKRHQGAIILQKQQLSTFTAVGNSLLRWEAAVAIGSINKEERRISKLGISSTAFLERVSSDEETGEGNFQGFCHPLGQTSQ